MPCFDIVGAPIAEYVDIGLRAASHGTLAIGGSVALDRFVDKLQLAIRPHRQPWCLLEHVDLDGFARSWEGLVEREAAEYDLSLLAEIDGREAPVLDREGTWARVVGRQFQKHSDLDRALYEALCSFDVPQTTLDDAAYAENRRRLGRAVAQITATTSARATTIERCITILASSECNRYQEAILTIFAAVGRKATVSDLSALATLDGAGRKDARIRLAAVGGLPIASAAPSLWRIDSVSKSGEQLSDLMQMNRLTTFFLPVARSMDPDGQASLFIDSLADDSAVDGLLRSYAKLLRITIATDVAGDLQRLSDELDFPDTRTARNEASVFLEQTDLPLDALFQLPSVGSLFARCVNTIWWFALASRIALSCPKETPIPLGAVILSRWLYNGAFSSLVRCTLTIADEYCKRIKLDRSEEHIC